MLDAVSLYCTDLILNSTILSTDAVFMPNKILKNIGSLFAKIWSVSQYYQISTCTQMAKAEKKRKMKTPAFLSFLLSLMNRLRSVTISHMWTCSPHRQWKRQHCSLSSRERVTHISIHIRLLHCSVYR